MLKLLGLLQYPNLSLNKVNPIIAKVSLFLNICYRKFKQFYHIIKIRTEIFKIS